MKIYVSILIGWLLCWGVSCTEAQEPTIASAAEAYLNEVLDLMEANSINRKTINWIDFRSKVFEKAGAAQTIDETYDAIREALTLLGDDHSFVIKPDGTGLAGVGTIRCNVVTVPQASVPETVGYVRVTSFSGSEVEARDFAQAIQDQIRFIDAPTIEGWIVDLRGNSGGNMWPMLAGIGPILGEGVVGHFIDPDDNQYAWEYRNGTSISSGFRVIQALNPYQLINPKPRVAVLLDNGVASSGEAVAIAFVGRENTRSFGSPTCGLSTANAGYTLSNDAQLLLTVSYMADRNKNLFGTPVPPDEAVSPQDIVERAVGWVRE